MTKQLIAQKISAIIIVLTILFIGVLIIPIESVYAYNTNVSGGGSVLEPSKEQLENALDNPKYNATRESIYGTIVSFLNTDIYHYQAPNEGYYAIYTVSDIDTVGRIYEHQNFLWWTTEFKPLSQNDDGNIIGDNYRDFSIVERFEAKESYVIAVRGYGDHTGSYYLKIEPNEDKYKSTNGGTWKSQTVNNSAAVIGTYISQKQYLTLSETLLFYYFLNPASQESFSEIYHVDNIYNVFQKDEAEALSLCIGLLGLIPGLPYSISVSVTILGGILSYIHELSNPDAYKMMQFLANDCGVRHNISTGEWSVQKGLLLQKNISKNMIPPYFYTYEAYTGDILTGQSYCKGEWIE